MSTKTKTQSLKKLIIKYAECKFKIDNPYNRKPFFTVKPIKGYNIQQHIYNLSKKERFYINNKMFNELIDYIFDSPIFEYVEIGEFKEQLIPQIKDIYKEIYYEQTRVTRKYKKS